MPIKINRQAYDKALKRMGLTNLEVAQMAGVHYTTLMKWLQGVRHPNSANIDALSRALEIHPKKLFELAAPED